MVAETVAKPGKVVGRVVYAAGDGAEQFIPMGGPCEMSGGVIALG